MMGSPVASTTVPFTVPACIMACTSFTLAKACCGLPTQSADAIAAENKILFDENFRNSFFIIYKFKINTIDIDII